MSRQVVSLRLGDEMLAWATSYAASRGVSRTELVENALVDYREGRCGVRSGWSNDVVPVSGGGNLRSVEPFAGMRVVVLEGDGTSTVLREVVHYFDEHGNRVAVVDPFPTGQVEERAAPCPCGDPNGRSPCTPGRPCSYAEGMPAGGWAK